ncbi:MAG: hypothetical protein MMC33_004628 [Icmadophila ericetorum]|nr:hypothetical protein [Icmadophila ericetorum]
MAGQKRKRSDAPSTPQTSKKHAGGGALTPRSTQSPGPDSSTTPPFTIEYLRDVNAKPSKKRRGNKDLDYSPGLLEQSVDGTDPVAYTILPGSNWSAMRKYKNFVVGESTFGVHDFIYVNSGQRGEDDAEEDEESHKDWIARVLEVRATDPTHVYLRIYWMYWPEELPAGREKYHGKNELVASNHMEIIDAMTVSDQAEIVHWGEKDDDPMLTGLYWRQRYNYITKKLSPLRRSCVCKQYHNPDKLLIHCSNPDCDLWLHEDCIVKAALKKVFEGQSDQVDDEDAKAKDPKTEGNGDLSGTIEVALNSARKLARGMQEMVGAVTKQSPVPTPTPAKKKPKMRKVENGLGSWEGKLEAKIETKPKAETDDDETQEITGKLLVTDLRGDEPKILEETLVCPNCEKPLT